MRQILRIFTGLAIPAACLVSATALAQDSFDVSRHANFSAIRTYAFKYTPPLAPLEEKTTTYDSPIMRERTDAAIAAQLEARGMKRNDEHPDVYIVSRRAYYTETYYYGPYGWGWGPYAPAGYGPYYGSGWGGWGGDTYAQLRGTLTVDLVDSKSGAVLWRGVEDKHVHQSSKPASRDRRVGEEVADIFKHFPTIGAVATAGER
jgi:predicted heme/steroid binding protein